MSSVDLTILGFLMEKPMSPYEIVKVINDRNIKDMVKISEPAIYKNIIKLHSKGYLGKEIAKEGERPEKAVYSMNDSGRGFFLELMENSSNRLIKIGLNFNAFIINLDKVDKETGIKMLDKLKKLIYEHSKILEISIGNVRMASIGSLGVLRQHEMVFETLKKWIDWFYGEYIAEKEGSEV